MVSEKFNELLEKLEGLDTPHNITFSIIIEPNNLIETDKIRNSASTFTVSSLIDIQKKTNIDAFKYITNQMLEKLCASM